MKGKQEILATIQRLKDACGKLEKEYQEDALELFLPLEEAVEAYFKPLAGLARALGDSAYQLAFNLEYRQMEFVNQAVMPRFGNDYPKGYEDVRELFDGGGAWQEMEGMDAEEFVAAFQFTETEGEGGVEEETSEPETSESDTTTKVTVSHPLIEEWAARIVASREQIVPGLEEISAYCESGATSMGMAVYFENHGGLKSSPSHSDIATRIYIDSGYAEIIKAYGLEVYVPSSVSK